MISVGGVAVIGGTSGLPAGGTSADVLTGDGAWTAGSDVLHDGLAAFTGSVAGRVIVGDGNGDVQPTSAAVSAALASADAPTLAAQVDAGRVTTAPLTSESGWTPYTVTAPGTAAIAAGAMTASIPNGSTTGNAGGGRQRAWPLGAATHWRTQARFTFTGDTDANVIALLFHEFSGGDIFVQYGADGAVKLRENFGPSVLATKSSAPTGGTGWVRLECNGNRLTAWTGTGVGTAEPTSWTLLYGADFASLVTRGPPATYALIGRSGDTHAVAGATTVAISSVTLVALL